MGQETIQYNASVRQSSPTLTEDKMKTKEIRQPFPCKVYKMLEDADDLGFNDIVSWNKEGNGFMVHNKERFIADIVPKYYNQTRYKSFQRQLSLYGFQRATVGPNKGLRYHPKMRKGCEEQCREMKPIGYKPRGHEYRVRQRLKKEKISSQEQEFLTDVGARQTGTAMQNDSTSESIGIPAVVSSNSLNKDPIQQALVTHPPLAIAPVTTTVEITDKLFSTDTVVFFEGMPFYLMTTTGNKVLPPDNVGSHPITSDSVAARNVDTQMRKAWEIGFAMAKAMNSVEP